ncbi:hypothetical protein Patl1_33107 [Pistacia atlantica]|uniref:Uncharacterized protein n=1 Tax=Pistacia atlantica TaxID=434234 RepID=A0ACC1ANU8_9ROSI|nr:hypothetical protein Patl1_33107 [Pistacia atlantica]
MDEKLGFEEDNGSDNHNQNNTNNVENNNATMDSCGEDCVEAVMVEKAGECLSCEYVVGETKLEASKEGRTLEDFKYGCVGYSVYLDNKDSSTDKMDKEAELPFCVGLENKNQKSNDNVVNHQGATDADYSPSFGHKGVSVAGYNPVPYTFSLISFQEEEEIMVEANRNKPIYHVDTEVKFLKLLLVMGFFYCRVKSQKFSLRRDVDCERQMLEAERSYVNRFASKDQEHPQSDEIYETLEGLAMEMKNAGYRANLSSNLDSISQFNE